MLIVSKHRDYYDTAHNGWIDKTVVYDRNEVRTTCPSDMFKLHPYSMGRIHGGVACYTDNFYVIGFCGKLYPAFRIKWKRNIMSKYHTEIFYDIDEYFERKRNIKVELNYWRDSVNWGGKKSKGVEYGDNSIKTMFEKYKDKEDMALFRQHNTPIFIACREFDKELHDHDYKSYSMLVNAKLEYYEFYKIKNAPEAFQDIQSFISGVLGMPAKEPEPVSDKVKVAAHGFDLKWSFRKEPTKKIK